MQPSGNAIIGLYLNGVVPAFLGFPIALSAVPIFLNGIEPTYHLFTNFSPRTPYLKLALRVGLTFLVCLHSAIIVFTTSIMLCNAVIVFLGSVHSIANIKGKIQPPSNFFSRIVLQSRFLKRLSIYRQLQILVSLTNQFIYYSIPMSMFSLFVLVIILGYVIIKLTGQVPLTLTLVAISDVAMIVAMAQFVFPLMADIYCKSISFVDVWKEMNVCKVNVKQLISCKPFGIKVGPFYYIRKSSRVEFLTSMLYYTVSMVISFS